MGTFATLQLFCFITESLLRKIEKITEINPKRKIEIFTRRSRVNFEIERLGVEVIMVFDEENAGYYLSSRVFDVFSF